jgi:hypothetical protein
MWFIIQSAVSQRQNATCFKKLSFCLLHMCMNLVYIRMFIKCDIILLKRIKKNTFLLEHINNKNNESLSFSPSNAIYN